MNDCLNCEADGGMCFECELLNMNDKEYAQYLADTEQFQTGKPLQIKESQGDKKMITVKKCVDLIEFVKTKVATGETISSIELNELKYLASQDFDGEDVIYVVFQPENGNSIWLVRNDNQIAKRNFVGESVCSFSMLKAVINTLNRVKRPITKKNLIRAIDFRNYLMASINN